MLVLIIVTELSVPTNHANIYIYSVLDTYAQWYAPIIVGCGRSHYNPLKEDHIIRIR